MAVLWSEEEGTVEAKHVYQAISAITAIMAREGISKSRKNEQQGYKFRGIDDIYAALSGHLADQKLCILPRVVDRTALERPTKNGGLSTYTIVTVEFDLVSAIDGSTHTIRTVGEAMDTADKSSNKAQSAAMKYACLMAFQIPTEGDNDADAVTHDTRAPSLVGQLQASVDLLEWEKLATARLLSAQSLGELQESWAVTMEQARKQGAPEGVVRKIASAKDAAKKALAPKNGTASAT